LLLYASIAESQGAVQEFLKLKKVCELEILRKNATFVRSVHLKSEQNLAYKMLRSKWMIDSKSMSDKFKENRIPFQGGVENELVINRVIQYFESIIKPHLDEKFDSCGVKYFEKLEAIEFLIRKTILRKIK
jgi:hypothetical protein